MIVRSHGQLSIPTVMYETYSSHVPFWATLSPNFKEPERRHRRNIFFQTVGTDNFPCERKIIRGNGICFARTDILFVAKDDYLSAGQFFLGTDNYSFRRIIMRWCGQSSYFIHVYRNFAPPKFLGLSYIHLNVTISPKV